MSSLREFDRAHPPGQKQNLAEQSGIWVIRRSCKCFTMELMTERPEVATAASGAQGYTPPSGDAAQTVASPVVAFFRLALGC